MCIRDSTTAVGSMEHAPEKERKQIFAHAGKRVSQQLSGNINQNSTMSNIVMSLASCMAFTRNFSQNLRSEFIWKYFCSKEEQKNRWYEIVIVSNSSLFKELEGKLPVQS